MQSIAAAKYASSDLIGIITRVIRAHDAGLDVNDREAITQLAKEIEPALVPRINPDRRYRIAELEAFGFKRGHFYKVYRHLIRKDGKMSYVLGRDLLALIEVAPTVADSPPRRRGRPRKSMPIEARDARPGDE